MCSIIKAMSICAYLWTTNVYVHKCLIVCTYIFWSSILLPLSCKCNFSTYSKTIIRTSVERSFINVRVCNMYTFTAVYIHTYIWIIIILLKYAFVCVNMILFQVMAHENVFGMRRVLYWIGNNCFITNESNIFSREYA